MDDIRFINLEYIFSRSVGIFQDIGSSGGLTYVSSFITFLKVIGILATIIFIIIIIYTSYRIFELEQEEDVKFLSLFIKEYKPKKHPFAERWARIDQLFMSRSENDWRVAIIEADSMLDDFLITLGYPGDNLGERLKSAHPGDFPTLQNAWEAHKIRNRIAHEGMNYHLTEREVNTTRKHFEIVFRDAGLI